MRSKALHIFTILLLSVGMTTTAKAQIKILGNVYGGGDQAAVRGNTTVEINKGQYGGDIFGGGNGALYDGSDGVHTAGTVKSSADIGAQYDGTDGVHEAGTLVEGTGTTSVTINGGKFIVEQKTGNPATDPEVGKFLNNNNVYGGGNLACNVFGSTAVALNTGMLPTEFFAVDNTTDPANPTSMYRKWGEYIGRIEGMTAAKRPDTPEKAIQGSVFGAGYGVHTSVLGNTSVNIAIGTRTLINDKEGILTRYNLAKRGGDASGETLASQFVITAFGGGYDGTVGGNTDVQISGSPMLQNVFGGGLGSKSGADASGGYASTVGTVSGTTNVAINGGTVYNNVYGGGAGIFGEQEITIPGRGTAKMPYYMASMVHHQTDVTISNGTIVFGNVYGGGDIANTGWYDEASRPTGIHTDYINASKAKLDLTTALHLEGGNVMGMVFGGGNGRKKAEIDRYNFVGAVIGNTSVVLGKKNGSTWDPGTKVWNNIYGGGQSGSVYSCAVMAGYNSTTATASRSVEGRVDGCTNVEIYNGDVGNNIFGGGWGDDPDGSEANKTSADISGNTYVYFEHGYLITDIYWDQERCDFLDQYCGEPSTNKYDDPIGRNTRSDLSHNLYGGGNEACVIGTKSAGSLVNGTGNVTVYMIGAPMVDYASFYTSEFYTTSVEILGSLHFSAFGGGFGKNAKVLGNINNNIALESAGFYSVVGGGMNGPVEGTCRTVLACKYNPAETNPLLNTRIHNVYGGGYYAPVGGAELNIAEAFITDNVFGGGVMGNIDPANDDMTKAVTKTTIGLLAGNSFEVKGDDGSTTYTYAYSQYPNRIYIGGNVYGGNDVSGTVNGVAKLNIHGGTIGHNVYGAGNGDHIGYYVPDILLYDQGAHGSDNYFYVDHRAPGVAGNTYVGRPQTIGGTEITLAGNSEAERVKVVGQVFGGGNSCTIGEWDKDRLTTTYAGNPHLVRDDPDYFLGGGKIDITLGSHISIGRTHTQLIAAADGEDYISDGENVSGLFMGCSGKSLATQTGAKTNNHYHHYFDAHAYRYYPGFAVDDENGQAMDRLTQLKPFQAYLNNILVWSDNVRLNIANDAEDIWLANFVGGGFRGSMRTKQTTGTFDYTLPEGVTVGNAIVAGAYNAHVQYHYFNTDADGNFTDADANGEWDYATTVPAGWVEGTDYVRVIKDNDDNITSIVRYNYNGGMLSENSTGVNSSDPGSHIHQVHADPREEGISDEERRARYATSYFEPMPADSDDPAKEDDATRAKLYTANKDKVLMHLDLQCALEPEVMTDAGGNKYVHGGNVFGGCFLSGFVEGDSWVDYNCWLSPNCTDPTFFSKDDNWQIYTEAMDIERNNALNAYGAGYGTDTHSMGDVYLSIKAIEQDSGGDGDKVGHFPYIFNAFGGSNMGEVDGNVNVYYAVGKQGTLLGSLYGGGYKGDIHGNTFVELAEGFVNNVYGGSRQANIGGAAHVWAYDGKARGIDNANHLIICNLYGGNDIAGTISGTMPAYFTESRWTNTREPITGHTFNTYVEISADDESADRGFPLVGSAFAGGNGEAWVSETASGARPNVAKALIEIDGGSTLRAFGGGNMATVTDSTFILTDAKSTNFADVTFTEYQKNIVQNIFFRDVTVGYKWEDNRLTMDDFHVARLFGGNNLATMDIQPTWNLVNGRLQNVYSGGNMGNMTYYNPEGKPATQHGNIGETAGVEDNADGSNSNYTPRGLSITIDQPDIYIGSLFGGCRLSDVRPNDAKPADYDEAENGSWSFWPTGDDGDDFYGATVNILDGYIENVYGGNDISGTVYHGTNVNISGAVSGNVYGSGNGFYLYQWDKDIEWENPLVNPYQTHVIEEYNSELKELVYHVKPVDTYGGNSANDTQKLLAINSYRPSVEKAFLNIAGLEHYPAGDDSNPKRVAYVKGNVFCGGNASTLMGDDSFSKFKIGSYVTLNGVFMGSDGYEFTQNDHIKRFADLNDFSDMGASITPSAFPDWDGTTSEEASHYTNLLNVYMKAVEMKAQPKDFNLNLPLKEAHIGTYCGGGNRGSMLVDKTVTLPFHHDIIIYDKIVAACLDANVKYNQDGNTITSYGGYTRAITDHATYGNTKMKLDIASQFVPLVMDVPADKQSTNSHGEDFITAAAHDFLYDNRTEGVKYTYEEYNDLFQTTYEDQAAFEKEEGENNQWKEAPGIYAPSCNIYGGCYQSGEVEGDIELNLYSNMLRYVNKADLDKSLEKNIACFNVYGAGFGQDSHVWGNVHITMDRSLDQSTMGTIGTSTVSTALETELGGSSKWNIQNQAYTAAPTALDCSYPSFNNVIGGGRNGKLIGNSTIEIRNGLVYSDVAGGCYASDMYGSTQVIVGYPKYWRCNTTGEYNLDRGDKWNTDKKDGYGQNVIKQTVKYQKGDLVPNNVYESIVAKTAANASMFTEVSVVPSTTNDARGWDDVFVKIGKGVYGGGYSLANSTAASAGNITTNKLKNDGSTTSDLHAHNFDGRWLGEYDEANHVWTGDFLTSTTGYGGNSSIMVGDQDGGTRDHIHISTLTATVANIPATSSVIGKFIRESDGRYTHQGDHTPVDGVTYYTLTGDGGIYGDGHLTFCEGFRASDVTRYGWAEGTPKHPILMNTFQRMDLLSVNDCCLMLQGAQDFATDQIDATVYSITRINELRMNSSLDATGTLKQISAVSGAGNGPEFDTQKVRNYLAFFNNVHYLGSIVTNDPFASDFHSKDGTKVDEFTYIAKKQKYIDDYKGSALDSEGNKSIEATNLFKQRNVATARNAIGINNGYCLRVQNQEYEGTGASKVSKQYYGPVVGVCEVKLLTLVQGEGGGYVYADNVHEEHDGHSENDYFLMTSGNFVFPGIIEQGNDAHGNPIGDQYIVDDCFLEHFGRLGNITEKQRTTGAELDEAHYWYVEGNRYFFTTTLTGFTYQKDLIFNLTKTDPNIILSGLESGSKLNIKKIEWLSAESGFHRAGYEAVLPNDENPDKVDDYEFDIEIGGYDTDDWKSDMPRHNVGNDDNATNHYTHGLTLQNNHLPQFNIKLQDKLDNSGDLAYNNHLDEPELVKIYLQGQTGGQIYEYTITVNIVYLQGPTVEGGVRIENCALPGELIGFSTDGLQIKTPELMPITAASWQILPLKQINADGSMEWDMDNGIIIPSSRYAENLDGEVEGTIRALYKQNEYNIAYIFTAGGYDFPVMPAQTISYASVGEYNAAKGTSLTLDQFKALPEAEKKKGEPAKENRMIVVHNYHRMKEVESRSKNVERSLAIETMPSIPDYRTDPASHHSLAEAKIYIEDEDDLRAFVNYLNMAEATYTDDGGIEHEGNVYNLPVGLAGLDIILQNDITLTRALPAISVPFAGNFHGDGYHIDLGTYGTSLFGNMLAYETDAESNVTKQGKVYNLGLINGESIAGNAQDDQVVNSYVFTNSEDFTYGKKAYELSHYFTPTADGYVEGRYANGDYQYATTDRVWSLRTGVPNYGNVATRHDQAHTHDAARWQDTDDDSEPDSNVPLYDGTKVVADRTVDVSGNGTEYFTYRGLPVGYANDYLFFGQHLDKTSADDYPMHIEDVATGDADRSKGGNRVYETAGYHHSSDNDGFYYNRDAWAIQPTLTAVDYTNMTAEGDGAETLPSKFSVDSNKDYDADGNPIASSPYSNAVNGHVSQNLLVYNAGEDVFDQKDVEDIAENAVTYHNLVKNGSIFETEYFHLVDKQCFNAPVAFNVTNRAWYERMPKYFRNVSGDRESYGNPSAWEGICLPFTATKVRASENGEISHFYGENAIETIDGVDYDVSELHHEYWLNGFTAMSNASTAFFARPVLGTELRSDLFVQSGAVDYTYENTYFKTLDNYVDHYDTRNPELEWYNRSHKFANYPQLSAGVPYIISFPGNDFYEFSLEGTDYDVSDHTKSGDVQTVTFESIATSENPIAAIIAISDEENHKTTVDGKEHVGTYMWMEDKDSSVPGVLGMNDNGSSFDVGCIALPFRTYMNGRGESKTRSILIMDPYLADLMEEESEHPADELGEDYLKIWGEGRDIVVETSKICSFNLFGLSGAYMGKLECKPGINRFTQEVEGIYLVGKTKVLLK